MQLLKTPTPTQPTNSVLAAKVIEKAQPTIQSVDNTAQGVKEKSTRFALVANENGRTDELENNGTVQDSLQAMAVIPQVQENITQALPEDLTNDTTFADIKKLVVEVDFCDIELVRASNDKVKLQADINEFCNSTVSIGRKQFSKSITRLGYDVKAGELRVYTDVILTKERRQVSNTKQSKIRLIVPDNLQIEIRNGCGSILAEGVSSGTILLETRFGSITASNLKGEITISASSGSIKAQNLEGPTRVKTEFGSIKLDHVVGSCNVTSSSGSVFINDVEGALEIRSSFGSQKISGVKGSVKSISSSGSVKMAKITGDLNCTSSFGAQTYDEIVGDITAQSSSGSIQLNGFRGKLNLTTSFGGIKGEKISLTGDAVLKASSGSIHLELLNDAEDLRYDLSSSSGSIAVEQNGTKVTGKDDLKIGTGKWEIDGVTTFGSQSYRLVKLP
jgi:DUF4097 and DUF4098 domain-containing protein YvlB